MKTLLSPTAGNLVDLTGENRYSNWNLWDIYRAKRTVAKLQFRIAKTLVVEYIERCVGRSFSFRKTGGDRCKTNNDGYASTMHSCLLYNH